MAVCRNISKCCLAIVNVFFLLLGAGLISLGSYMFVMYARYGDDLLSLGTALLPALILLCVGILAILLGILGCVATFNNQKCVTGLFFTLLLLLFVGLIAGGVLSYAYSRNIDTGLRDLMYKGLDEYDDNKEVASEIDLIQSEAECCGVANYTDWLQTPWYKNQSEEHKVPYPESCCVGNCTYNMTHDVNLFDKGCYSKLIVTLNHHLIVVGSVAGGFAIILMLGMVLSCVLILTKHRRTHEVPYIGLPDPNGMRV